MIAVVDYGGGNLCSVLKALEFLGASAIVTKDPAVLRTADKIVLPGVGEFGDAARALRESGLDVVLKEEIGRGKPFFGICLGMQLLFQDSEESVGAKGLGIFDGSILKFPPKDKVPHMGWNDLLDTKGEYLKEGAYVYFVHSFYAPICEFTAAKTKYAGLTFSAAIERDNVFGAQFHPEKSGDTGLEILRRFVSK